MTLYILARDKLSVSPLVADAITVLAATILLAVSAKISVPFYPVPMTMQTFVVIGLGLSMGARRSALAVLLYMAEGAAGLPVFTGTPEKGLGLAYMVGPTGGFLVGFVIAAFFAGWCAEQKWDRTPLKTITVALLASALVYVPGLIWLGLAMGFNSKLLAAGLYPFLAADIVKSLLAALVFPAAWHYLSPAEKRR